MGVRVFGVSVLLIFTFSFSRCSTLRHVVTPVRKLLIDTDAGGDDAVAIIMAAVAEETGYGPKVMGITCVNGNTHVDQVALNVLKTLNVVNRLDIPVYKGAEHPLLRHAKKDYVFGCDGFGDFHYPKPPSKDLIQPKHAVMAMIDLVKQHPGEVTLLTLGPLTNIALAIKMHPSFLDDLQQLIAMGGSTDGIGNIKPGIEFNFSTDPAANYIVLNASTSNPVTLLPFDSMLRNSVPRKLRDTLSELNNTKVWLIDSADSLYPEDVTWENPDGANVSGMIIVDYLNSTGQAANTNLIQGINVTAFEQLVSRCFQ